MNIGRVDLQVDTGMSKRMHFCIDGKKQFNSCERIIYRLGAS